VLATYAAPEQAILDVRLHGTTLATHALIEPRGAKVAFVTTEGFRNVIKMRTESRFDRTT
jgi:N-methylhydantoinase A